MRLLLERDDGSWFEVSDGDWYNAAVDRVAWYLRSLRAVQFYQGDI